MNFTKATDSQLIKKQKQVVRIMEAPYRPGLNYQRLLDMRGLIADQLYINSLNRVFNR